MARFSALGRIDTGTTGCARLIRESKLSCIIHGRASLLSSPRHAASFESGTFGIPSQDGEGGGGGRGNLSRFTWSPWRKLRVSTPRIAAKKPRRFNASLLPLIYLVQIHAFSLTFSLPGTGYKSIPSIGEMQRWEIQKVAPGRDEKSSSRCCFLSFSPFFFFQEVVNNFRTMADGQPGQAIHSSDDTDNDNNRVRVREGKS